MAKCVYWGENRADEFFIDVGCVVGHCQCPDNPECADFKEQKGKT